MPAYDFYNPVMSARIVTKEGEIVPLWIGSGTGGELQAALEARGVKALPFVSEVGIDISLGYMASFSVTLTPPMEIAQEILNATPSIVEWGQSKVEIQVGYAGESPVLSPVFRGLLQKPEVSLGEDITIVLRATGPAAFSASRQESNLTGKRSRREWVQALAKGTHLGDTRSVEVDFSEADKDPEAKAELDKEVEIAQSYQSDYWMVWSLVKAAKCWLVDSGGTWKVISRKTSRLSTPRIKLAFHSFHRGQMGPSVGTYPILGVSSPSMAMFIPGASRGIILSGVSSKDKKAVEKSVSATPGNPASQDHAVESVDAVTQGKQAPPEDENFPGAKNSSGGVFHYGDPTNQATVDSAKGALDLSTSLMGIPLTVETLGVPDLGPGQVVQVVGLGERFDGNYYVNKVEHSFGTGGFSSTLNLISNAAKIAEGFDPAGQVNTQEADPDATGTVNMEAESA